MSLLNLKKSKPLAKPSLRSVEAFIDDAILYAQGQSKSVRKAQTTSSASSKSERAATNKAVPITKTQRAEGMRHATFTLTPECIEKLSVLSAQTGKAKSALIREWITQHAASK